MGAARRGTWAASSACLSLWCEALVRPTCWTHCVEPVHRCAAAFAPDDLTNVLWGAATLGRRDPPARDLAAPAMAAVFLRTCQLASQLEDSQLVAVGWALGSWEDCPAAGWGPKTHEAMERAVAAVQEALGARQSRGFPEADSEREPG